MRVLILAAITVDGKIARGDAEFTGWSSREDKRLFARTSREAGVVVMGRRTFETLPAPLPGRLNVVLSHERPAIAARWGRIYRRAAGAGDRLARATRVRECGDWRRGQCLSRLP